MICLNRQMPIRLIAPLCEDILQPLFIEANRGQISVSAIGSLPLCQAFQNGNSNFQKEEGKYDEYKLIAVDYL